MFISPSRIAQLLLGLVLGLIVTLASVGLLALSGWLICAAALAGLHPAIAPYFNYFIPAAGIRFFAVLRILSRYAERIVTHDTTFRILSDLKVWFYKKLEPLTPAYLMRYPMGDLLNRSIADIDILDHVYLRLVIPFTVAILLSFCLLIFLHHFSWKIAWLVCISMLSIIFIVSTLSWWMGNKVSKSLQCTISHYRIYLIDLFDGMKEWLLYGAHKQKLQQIFQTQMLLNKLQSKLSQLQGISLALVICVSGLIIWFALYLCIPLVHSHRMSAPVFCMIVLVILAAFEVLIPLPSAFLQIGRVCVSASRLKTIANERPDIVFSGRHSISTLSSYDIKIENVDFAYLASFPIFRNLNLSIPFKEKLAIMGPSGVGKTSLLYLLARIYDPIKGKIIIDNTSIKAFKEADLRRLICLVTQQEYFFHTSIKENLCIANQSASDEMLWAVLKKVQLDKLVENRKGMLSASMGEYGQYFSVGQLRRFSIARALLSDTPIAMFDEPTEGLDAKNATLIWQLLTTTLKDKTVIVVTHQLPIDITSFRIFDMPISKLI